MKLFEMELRAQEVGNAEHVTALSDEIISDRFHYITCKNYLNGRNIKFAKA